MVRQVTARLYWRKPFVQGGPLPRGWHLAAGDPVPYALDGRAVLIEREESLTWRVRRWWRKNNLTRHTPVVYRRFYHRALARAHERLGCRCFPF